MSRKKSLLIRGGKFVLLFSIVLLVSSYLQDLGTQLTDKGEVYFWLAFGLFAFILVARFLNKGRKTMFDIGVDQDLFKMSFFALIGVISVGYLLTSNYLVVSTIIFIIIVVIEVYLMRKG